MENKEGGSTKKTISDALELLGCAEINCDNVKKLGVGFADFVKIQVQEAMAILEAIEEESAA